MITPASSVAHTLVPHHQCTLAQVRNDYPRLEDCRLAATGSLEH
jgi:hypothetical protein